MKALTDPRTRTSSTGTGARPPNATSRSGPPDNKDNTALEVIADCDS